MQQFRDAIHFGDLTTVSHFIEMGFSVDDHVTHRECKNPSSTCPPLALAASLGHIDIVTFLLEKGAHVNAKSSKKLRGGTALYWAMRCNFPRIVNLLLAHGADAFITDTYGLTPLACLYKMHHIILHSKIPDVDYDGLSLKVHIIAGLLAKAEEQQTRNKKLKQIHRQLIETTWKTSRFIDWCLDVEERLFWIN